MATATLTKPPTHPIVKGAGRNAFILLMKTRVAMEDYGMDDQLALLEVQAASVIEKILATATDDTPESVYLKLASIVMKWCEVRD